MSKAHMEKRRYILAHFEVPGAFGRRDLGGALKGHFRKLGYEEEQIPSLTRIDAPHAIIKTTHDVLDRVREDLPKLSKMYLGDEKHTITTRTMATSGTIKTLTDRFGVCKKR